MDRNSIIGFICIALILAGGTWYQVNSAKKKLEAQAESQPVAAAALPAVATQPAADTLVAAPVVDTVSVPDADSSAYAFHFRSPGLDRAYLGESSVVCLENEKLCVEFDTRGARPRSVRVKNFYNHDSTDLYLFKPGECDYSVSVFAGEEISTHDFNFELSSRTDTSLVFSLPFRENASMEFRYVLEPDSYSVRHEIAFEGGIIPRNVSNFDLDFIVTVPRMEKGYKNESQYSKLDYYFSGDKKPIEIGRGRDASKKIDSRLEWFAFQQQFFSAIMRSPEQFQGGNLGVCFFPKGDKTGNLMYCSANMRQEIVPSDNIVVPYEFYFGPNHFQTLQTYGCKYEKIIPLGGWLVGWFTRYAIIPMFNFFSRYFANFGLIILLMTLVIKLVVFPFTYKSFSSSAKMQALKPEIEKINQKYPKQEDAMKKQQATMNLYKRAGVSPMGGCLPTLLTLPILWAMFRFFPASIELRQQSFLWCDDLSAYDSILEYGGHIPILGDHLSLFALLMAVTMWLYSKMTMSNQAVANDPSAASMKFMSVWMMPIMMFFICNSLSAALSYYYLLSQLIAIVQTWFIRKFCVNGDAILEKVRASEGKPMPKSKWQMKLEEAQKMQEQQLRQQRRR